MKRRLFLFSRNSRVTDLCSDLFSGRCEFEILNSMEALKKCLEDYKNCIFLCDYDFFENDELVDRLKVQNGHKFFLLTTKIHHGRTVPENLIQLPFGIQYILKLGDFISETEKNSSLKPYTQKLTGNSPAIKKLRHQLLKASCSRDCVLFTGESGTGKSFAAKILHELSLKERKNKKLVMENITAIPETLMESELFGVEGGAYTDSKGSREGLIGSADGGSVFFDEIGDLPLHLQPKLLLAVQEGIIRKVGSDKSRKVDVRYIFATNKNLHEKIREGTFRKDLFFRISSIEIEIPPLRDRKEDIAEISGEFFKKRGLEFVLSRQAVEKLQEYDWPGNIRELENCLAGGARNSRSKVINPEAIHFSEQARRFW
ncbi:sigma 54-interacting transcriptional regulator [uncultured Treponema sp.]|uniref:sigma 54-interacting transcriptional regulator n=1 Tax=uncultured Treponema sp. TaxID=162155 RepID=UPI0015C1A7DE|nr:sigma 54-interacting transcriptional regulator [uncultured Treponema sp.]